MLSLMQKRLRMRSGKKLGRLWSDTKYEALGKAVYDAKKADSDPADLVAEAMVAIDELKDQMKALEEQIQEASAQL